MHLYRFVTPIHVIRTYSVRYILEACVASTNQIRNMRDFLVVGGAYLHDVFIASNMTYIYIHEIFCHGRPVKRGRIETVANPFYQNFLENGWPPTSIRN